MIRLQATGTSVLLADSLCVPSWLLCFAEVMNMLERTTWQGSESGLANSHQEPEALCPAACMEQNSANDLSALPQSNFQMRAQPCQ